MSNILPMSFFAVSYIARRQLFNVGGKNPASAILLGEPRHDLWRKAGNRKMERSRRFHLAEADWFEAKADTEQNAEQSS